MGELEERKKLLEEVACKIMDALVKNRLTYMEGIGVLEVVKGALRNNMIFHGIKDELMASKED